MKTTGRKHVAVLFSLVMLFCAGCQFEAPLATESSGPIDRALLGVWQSEADDDTLLLVLPFSDSEYMIQYGMDDDSIYYRGYPVEIGKQRYLQLEVIGSEEGVPTSENLKPFQVALYQVGKERLTVRLLDPDVVGTDLTSTAALRQAFLKHQAQPELFDEQQGFTRVKR